jgi:hypothetical protein
MKKLFTLFFIFLSLTLNLTAQNLIAGWSGNGVTGDLSKPNLVGWTNTNYASIPWNTANASEAVVSAMPESDLHPVLLPTRLMGRLTTDVS